MLIIIGYSITLVCILVGYVFGGGFLAALFQPLEFLIIGGAALGTFIVSNNSITLKATCFAIKELFKPTVCDRTLYLSLISLFFSILTKIRQNGALSLEEDIDNPNDSLLFQAYPQILENDRVCDFITDYLRLMISGNMDAHQITELMEQEIETYSHELDAPACALANVGDALPAFGIVAAVMGVIKTLAQADRPIYELGALIAHAMVGTFLGVLLAYGFISPLASLLRQKNANYLKILECAKVILTANMHGYAPQISIEFGRKVIFSHDRPSFFELEALIQQTKKGEGPVHHG